MAAGWQADRVRSALDGTNPTILARLPESFAVIGDVQWLPGYSVLISDSPGVDRLSDLPRDARRRYLASAELLADAVETTCGALDSEFNRVNIEILGNADPFLHTHIFPRYHWEPEHLRSKPVWLYPAEMWSDPENRLGQEHQQWRSGITEALARLAGATD